MPVPTAVPPSGQLGEHVEGLAAPRARRTSTCLRVAARTPGRGGPASRPAVGAADLDDVVELLRLVGRARRASASGPGIEVLANAPAGRDVDGRGNHVVGRLAHVDVVVGVDRLLARRAVPPASSIARLAITSLAFMLVEVPEPVWKMSSGNWSSSLPSTTSWAACDDQGAAICVKQPELVVGLRPPPI